MKFKSVIADSNYDLEAHPFFLIRTDEDARSLVQTYFEWVKNELASNRYSNPNAKFIAFVDDVVRVLNSNIVDELEETCEAVEIMWQVLGYEFDDVIEKLASNKSI